MKSDLNTLAARRDERTIAEIIDKLWCAIDRLHDARIEVEIALTSIGEYTGRRDAVERIADDIIVAGRFIREIAETLQ